MLMPLQYYEIFDNNRFQFHNDKLKLIKFRATNGRAIVHTAPDTISLIIILKWKIMVII